MKITLTDVKSGYNLSPLNANFQALQAELQDKVLYRDNLTGEPNQMESSLDMNNNNIRNVNELDVVTFKIQGEDATQFLNESVQQAETFANAAASSATDAQTAEDGADLALYNFNGVWYGSLASEPVTDPNGDAINDGDLYSNSTDGILYFYQGGTWNPLGGGNVTSVFGRTGAVTALAGDYTAAEVDYDNTTSGLTATDTQAAIDEVQAAVPVVTYQEVLIDTGSFSDPADNFTMKFLKVDNVVTAWTDDNVSHPSNWAPSSGLAIIPAEFVPDTDKAVVYEMLSAGPALVEIFGNASGSDGSMGFRYRDWAGAQQNRTTAPGKPSITYTV